MLDPFVPRAVCGRCLRPERVCYCAHLPRLETRTRVVILQHPRERDMPIGTARMARLCLPQAALHVGVRWDESAPLQAALADPAQPPILLFPGAGARNILDEPPRGPVTLVVVDGTWSQAKNVVRDNPVLAALPRYAFVAPEASQYRIRREPDAGFVSTIEALMHVLGVLEGDAERFRAMLAPFRAMVDAQLACQGDVHRARLRKPRPPRVEAPRVPAELRDRADDLVCIVGEANAWPYRARGGRVNAAERRADRASDELVHWVAQRLTTGELFDVVAAPERGLAPSTTFHTGLDAARIQAGVPRAELLERFAGFVRPSDIVCSWGFYSPDLFRASGGALPAHLDVRAAAQRLTNRKLGALEDLAATATTTPGPPRVDGRAGRRLALLLDVLTAWRSRL